MIYTFCLYNFSLKCIIKKLIYLRTIPLNDRFQCIALIGFHAPFQCMARIGLYDCFQCILPNGFHGHLQWPWVRIDLHDRLELDMVVQFIVPKNFRGHLQCIVRINLHDRFQCVAPNGFHGHFQCIVWIGFPVSACILAQKCNCIGREKRKWLGLLNVQRLLPTGRANMSSGGAAIANNGR